MVTKRYVKARPPERSSGLDIRPALSLEQLTLRGFELRDTSPCVEDQVLRRLRLQRLTSLINMLSANDRRLLHSLFFLEIPPRLLAARLNISEEEVRSRAKSVLLKLRKKAAADMEHF